jgi:dipeptidyl aminopeptidase/acylaminoacyl peptidase
MNLPVSTSSRRLPQRLAAIFRAALNGLALALACVIGGFVLGFVTAWTGLVREETATWEPLIGAFYGLVAGVALGPVFAWRTLAARFGIPRKIMWTTALALLSIISLSEFVLLRSPQVTGPSPSATRVYIDSVADDGRVVILNVEQNDSSALYKVETDTGRATRLVQASDFEEGGELSPDGKQVVFVSRPRHDDPSQIMLCDSDGSRLRPLFPEAHSDFAPHFSHNGRLIYFARPTSLKAYNRTFEIYAAKLDGTGLTQLTHRKFGSETDIYSVYPESVSADNAHILMKTESRSGGQLLVYPFTEDRGPPASIVPRIPDGPDHPQIVTAFFTPDDKSIVLMAASQGAKHYDYDVYRLEIATGKLEKLTATKGYASDFRISSNGETAAFFIWSFSRWNNVPIDPSLQLLNTRTRAVASVSIAGLP